MRHQRDEHAGERHRERQLAQREVPRLLEHLLLHLEPVAEQDHDQRDHREALHELPRSGRARAPRGRPRPSTNPAITKAPSATGTDLRASPEMSAPATSSTPNTASGASRNSTPAAIGGTGELCQTRSSHLATVVALMRRVPVLTCVRRRARRAGRGAGAAAPPRERDAVERMGDAHGARPPPRRRSTAPPEETAPEGAGPAAPRHRRPARPPRRRASGSPTQVPSVFDTRALPVALSGRGAQLPRELHRARPPRAGSAG